MSDPGRQSEAESYTILRNVLPPKAEIAPAHGHEADFIIAGFPVQVKWVEGASLDLVRQHLDRHHPDILVARTMSPRSRELAEHAGVGWADSSGDAEFAFGNVVVSRRSTLSKTAASEEGPSRWTRSHLGVAEAILGGVPPTVEAIASQTLMSTSTVAAGLKFLTLERLLSSDAARGPKSRRRVRDVDTLLDAFASASVEFQHRFSVNVGVFWRDPLVGARELGHNLQSKGLRWGVTSALSAEALAPHSTQVAPLVVYVDVATPGSLRSCVAQLKLNADEGGRLKLAPFPTKATRALVREVEGGLCSVSWPRAYADLRPTGVRGEEAAAHLKSEMLRRENAHDVW